MEYAIDSEALRRNRNYHIVSLSFPQEFIKGDVYGEGSELYF